MHFEFLSLLELREYVRVFVRYPVCLQHRDPHGELLAQLEVVGEVLKAIATTDAASVPSRSRVRSLRQAVRIMLNISHINASHVSGVTKK